MRVIPLSELPSHTIIMTNSAVLAYYETMKAYLSLLEILCDSTSNTLDTTVGATPSYDTAPTNNKYACGTIASFSCAEGHSSASVITRECVKNTAASLGTWTSLSGSCTRKCFFAYITTSIFEWTVNTRANI